MGRRSLEYVPLDEITPATTNAKGHDLPLIESSVRRFGVIEVLTEDSRTGRLIAGHGRAETFTLLRAAYDAGLEPPDGLDVDEQGRWLIPVVRGWRSRDDTEAEAAGVALNRSTEAGGWIENDLALILQRISATDAGLAGIGYNDDDLAQLLVHVNAYDRGQPVEQPDPDEIPPEPVDPVTKRGDVWLLGSHRMMCGDCRNADDVAGLLDGATINLAVTSPPYAEQREYDGSSGFVPVPPDDYVAWFAPVAAIVAQHLADDGSWLVNIKPPGVGLDTNLYVFDLVAAHVREWGWHFATEFCWERLGVPKGPFLRLKNQFEPVYQFARDRWKFRPDNVRYRSENAIVPLPSNAGLDRSLAAAQGGGKVPFLYPERSAKRVRKRPHGGGSFDEDHQGTNWQPGDALGEGWAYPGNRLPSFVGSHQATGHPAAYPIGLPAFLTKLFTDPGDVIYDPFVGSGSTILAAHQEDRIGFGMEISAGYCDVTLARWQRVTGEKPILASTGEPHDFAAADVPVIPPA